MESDNNISGKVPPEKRRPNSSRIPPADPKKESTTAIPDIPAVPESRYDLQVFQSMRRIIRAVDIYSRKLKATCRLTAPQLICLLNIVDHKRTTATKIAREVFLTPSTVVGVLDRLEARGLVIRSRDTNDRRVVNVTATETGTQLASSAPSPLQDSLASALARLPVEEQAVIASALNRIVDMMEADRLTAAPILETDQPDIHNSARDGGDNL
jgi:DNA-binding MarR family transcriptional regulator